MERIIIEVLGAAICLAVGFVYGYKKCKRDYNIEK